MFSNYKSEKLKDTLPYSGFEPEIFGFPVGITTN
jgi:hypothetical protein